VSPRLAHGVDERRSLKFGGANPFWDLGQTLIPAENTMTPLRVAQTFVRFAVLLACGKGMNRRISQSAVELASLSLARRLRSTLGRVVGAPSFSFRRLWVRVNSVLQTSQAMVGLMVLRHSGWKHLRVV
jgi:hypothetical protein